MSADTDIQVWLQGGAYAPSDLIVPYVQSVTPRTLQFHWQAVRQGPQGVSRISQRGSPF